MSQASAEDLRILLDSMDKSKERWTLDAWFVDHRLPSHDFNREIVEPGTNENFPNGAVGIRGDYNFWSVAVLPLSFRDLDCRTLVSILWPDIEDPTIYPDDNDPWWEAIGDDTMEVPGQPIELWYHNDYPRLASESRRIECAATEEELLALEARHKHVLSDGCKVEFEIKKWVSGSRIDGERKTATHIEFRPPTKPDPFWETLAPKG